MFSYYTPPFGLPPTHRQYLVATLATGLHSTKKLIGSVGAILGFPPHFGKNFDAFWDCLRDLPEKPRQVALIHRDIPKIPEDDLLTYLELLRDAALYWQRRREEHVFEVWFPDDSKFIIEGLLKEIPAPDDEELS